MNWLSVVQLVMQYGPAVASIYHTATSNEDVVQKLEEGAAPVGDLIKNIGAQLFPQASPALQIVGAVVSAFSPDYTKWLQGALNTFLELNPPLVVDGIYGAKTQAAVQQAQTKLGLTVDGIAGKLTQAGIAAMLARLPQVK